MTSAITSAHICGPIGQALAVVDGETWLYERGQRRRPSANEVNLFFQHGLEVRAVNALSAESLDEASLLSMLQTEERCFEALQGLLIGMDPELDSDLRRRVMR